MAPGRSPSRLRSKTSDISDLIRGNPRQHSTEALVPPVPPIPSNEAITPTKSRRKLAEFLGRKRKSGGFALEHGSHSQKVDEEYPAVPDALLQSRIPAPPSSGSSLPSSLPPLNVSPPSFGAAFTSPSTEPVTARFSTATSDSSLSTSGLRAPAPTVPDKSGTSPVKSGALRLLRPQKSTSFEVSRPFNFTHNATATNSAMLNGGDSKLKAKPVITVSAPPVNVADEHVEDFNAPRAAPAPPSASRPRSAKDHARKTLNFGFGHHGKKDEVKKRPSTEARKSTGSDAKLPSTDLPSPTPSLSPLLPAKMEFPVPPSAKGKQAATPWRTSSQVAPKLAGAFEYTPVTPTARTSRATITSDTSDGELSHASTRSAPVRPTRPASLIIPNSGINRLRSNSAMTVTKIPSSPSSPTTGKGLSPRLRSIRASRSPSPASPPPVTPLPSPPPSATLPQSDVEGWSTDASTRLGGWSTDNSTRIGSLASRKSMMSGARARAHTIVGSISKTPAASHSGLSSGGEDSDRARLRYMRSVTTPSVPEHLRTAQRATIERITRLDSSQEEGSSTPTASRTSSEKSHGSQETTTPAPTPTPTKEDSLAQSLRKAQDTYVRVLQEKHAAEKAELLRHIERLEHEARLRDEEIRGLRYIILHTSPPSKEPAAGSSNYRTPAMGRLSSGSKSSRDYPPTSRTSSSTRDGTDQASSINLNSPEESTEDGLLELQNEVSEFISPCYTPRMEPAQAERSGSPSSISGPHRGNTTPAKHAKRGSSPVVPGPSGLGFDIAVMSSSDSEISGTESSVPSLTTSNTASSTPSSTLSAIPELASDSEWTRRDKEERRKSSPLKRLSSSSIVQAASTYASNLKLGMSPSIGQVLDRTRADQEADMDEVLRKLRAFGGEH